LERGFLEGVAGLLALMGLRAKGCGEEILAQEDRLLGMAKKEDKTRQPKPGKKK